MAKILFDQRWSGTHGIGRFTTEMSSRIPGMCTVPMGLGQLHPLDSLWTSAVIEFNKPDLYFSPGFNPPLRCRVPFVFTIHDLIHLKSPSESSFFKRIYYQRIVRPACHRATHVFTVSEFSRQEIVEWSNVNPSRVINVGCGVGESFTPEGLTFSHDRPYLLYVGNYKPHKNLPRLLDAFFRSALATDISLFIVGDPTVQLRNIISDLHLDTSVVFTGRLTDIELAQYYRGAQALVSPSLYEGFGLPVLEAMACGTPVIASNVTSIPEVVGSAACLINPLNVEMMAETIQNVVNDEVLRKEMARKGIEQAAKFSWQATADKIRDVLMSSTAKNLT